MLNLRVAMGYLARESRMKKASCEVIRMDAAVFPACSRDVSPKNHLEESCEEPNCPLLPVGRGTIGGSMEWGAAIEALPVDVCSRLSSYHLTRRSD